MTFPQLTSVEICTGAGGQALGLEHAGFSHLVTIENDPAAFSTLTHNRPWWNPLLESVKDTKGAKYSGVDLFAGGVPCPPFSIAGKQLGEDDDRDLFPAALQLIHDIKPQAVLLENVPGLAKSRFSGYRENLVKQLKLQQFTFVDWQILNACNYGVSQLRPRFVLVALKGKAAERFEWPKLCAAPLTVGERLYDLMACGGWPAAAAWAARANGIAPTLVGGSKKHGGPDLGPTRAKRAWAELGVDGHGIADAAPGPDFPSHKHPKLTVRMSARLQGFPDTWVFQGRKTAAYRQVGNAFPPPVARAVGDSIRKAILGIESANRELPEQGQLRLVAT
jgi:DNA (cytosine-5)-methyltransferase 1